MTDQQDPQVIHTRADGLLGGTTTPETVAAIARGAADRVVLHFHGGLVQIVTGNLREILVEDLCRRLLRWLLRYTVGKLTQGPGQRGTVLTLLAPMEVRRELDRTASGAEPYAGTRPRADVPAVDRYEREQLAVDVAQDERLADELAAILADRQPVPRGTRVGAVIWAAMKKDTADTFAVDGRPRGGALFLRELGAARAGTGATPELTLVGHSTGAVFIDNFLDALARAVADADDPTPEGLRVRNVVMLAPACTFTHLAGALRHQDLVERFRIFTMTDEAERADHLVQGLYPRSLLYLVSGLLERDGTGASAHVPVAGLQRYYLDERYAALDGIGGVRDYAVATPDRLVWSPSPPDAPAGLRSTALSHGGFDEDPEVLDSIRSLVAGGSG